MADWPTIEELKRVLNFDPPQGYEEQDPLLGTLETLLEAAIAKVKLDVGNWDEYADEPDEALSMAALRMAELMALRPEVAAQASSDPTYQRYLFGHRRTFGVA